jgi:hypothetical protein
MKADDVKRPNELEAENATPVEADRCGSGALDIQRLKELPAGNF